jgi:predicted metal-dependent hydrolase
MRAATVQTIKLNGCNVSYRLVRSESAKKLRLRVGVGGVEVVQPKGRGTEEIQEFLRSNQVWILDQLERIERFRTIRRPQLTDQGIILFRGERTPVRVEDIARRAGSNQVIHDNGGLVIVRGRRSRTTPAQTLENWLRRQVRLDIERALAGLTAKLRHFPHKVYVMGQRTKWGNCSSLQNLSFNWRMIMAPEFVLRYLVTHEAVHLAVPDHSHKFWLTVQSLCPEMERAKQWLCANSHQLLADLAQSLGEYEGRQERR